RSGSRSLRDPSARRLDVRARGNDRDPVVLRGRHLRRHTRPPGWKSARYFQGQRRQHRLREPNGPHALGNRDRIPTHDPSRRRTHGAERGVRAPMTETSHRAPIPRWTRLLLLASILLISGCATVQPWERDELSDPIMMFDENPLDVKAKQHHLDYR